MQTAPAATPGNEPNPSPTPGAAGAAPGGPWSVFSGARAPSGGPLAPKRASRPKVATKAHAEQSPATAPKAVAVQAALTHIATHEPRPGRAERARVKPRKALNLGELDGEALLSMVEVAAALGIGLSTSHRYAASDPSFPGKLALSPRCVRYRVGDLRSWLAAKASVKAAA